MTDLGDFDEYDTDADTDVEETDDPASEPSSDGGTPETRRTDANANGDAAGSEDLPFQSVDVDPAGSDTGVGTIAVSEGLRVADRAEDTCLSTYITAGNRPSMRVGTYLLAPYPDGERLFCRVRGLEYEQAFHTDDATEIHARRAMRAGEIDEADYKFMADLEPLAVLFEDGDELKRRMADRVPKPETVVRQATDSVEIKTGLKIPEAGVFLGHLAVGGERVTTNASPPTIDYRLNDDYEGGDPLVFRHTLVAGGTGSGKTHAAKNVLRQFLAPEREYEMDDGRSVNPAVVVFDPQDEYAQMHDDPDLSDADRRRYDREGIAYGGVEDTKAFVPEIEGASYSTDSHRAEQVPFSVPFSMVRGNPWLVSGGQLNDNQYDALNVLLYRFFDDYGEGGTYEEFSTFVQDPALRDELDESGRVHEATFDAVKRRVLSGASRRVFDGSAPSIEDRIAEFVRPGGLSVVPTYHVNDSRATETVVLALASLLVDQKLSNDPDHDRVKEMPLILGMDEAHNFLTDADSVQARKVIGTFTEAAKQGRKERLGLFLVTQDPQDIADPVFKQVNTTVVLNLGDEDAIRSVNIPAELEGKVPYMEQGGMVVHSPDNSDPVEIMGLSNCLTRHGE
ncbi:AAA family ATPase [Halobacteriales archaeon SW_7_71_33]|nr:MAG: AAA family ATPase [Halobacteriales archaeon SW_7_71_33]